MSASIWLRAFAIAAAFGGLGGCFNAEEEVEGLPCENDMQCAGALVCRPIQDPITLVTQNECAESLDCPGTDTCDGSASVTVSTTDATMSTTDATVSTTDPSSSAESSCMGEGASCAAGEACCAGVCANVNGSYQCAQSCSNGIECAATCCCTSSSDFTGYPVNICVATESCGQGATCPGSGCASPGSLCGSDLDCCGGRCAYDSLYTATYRCFQTCSLPTDCVSGCCNYHSELSTSLCESC